MNKYKILVIAGTDLNNRVNGSVVVLLNYLKFIPENIEVDIINIGKNYDSKFGNINNINNISNDYFFKKYRKFIPFISISYNILERSDIVQNLITTLNEKNKYNLIYYQDIATMNYCDIGVKSIANFIDLQSYNSNLYYQKEKNILKKLHFFKEIYLCKFFEKRFVNKFEKIILVNKKEKEIANQIFKTNKFIDVPIGIPINENILSEKKIERIINFVFIGNMSFKPNRDGIIHFYEEYLKKMPDNYILNIVGPNNSLEIEDKRVNKIGFVEDLDKFLENMDFGIAIMINGAGQKNKILDYLSRGLPTFVNNFTHENNYFDSEYIYLVNNFEEILDKIKNIKIIERENIKKSIMKYSDENSAKLFWKIIDDTLKEI